jgi:hypothetical protein
MLQDPTCGGEAEVLGGILYFALLVVAYGANSVEVTPTLISVDLFVRDMSLVLAPLPDYILHNVYIFDRGDTQRLCSTLSHTFERGDCTASGYPFEA